MSKSEQHPGELRVTRLELRTLIAVDLGRVSDPHGRFLRDRGRPGWLASLEPRFATGGRGFNPATIHPPAYGMSAEHGRPTFSDEFGSSYMPITFKLDKLESHRVQSFDWHVEWIRVGPTGAMGLSVRADLEPDAQTTTVLEIVRSYHEFRKAIRGEWVSLVHPFLNLWSETLPEYSVDPDLAGRLWKHLEFYDVVDFDYVVDGNPWSPKSLYRDGPVNSVKSLAGLSRMSHVMDTYSEEAARSIAQHDLGNRADELWIVNVERMVRHHPEHLSDPAKRLYMQDIVTGIEILLQQRATLNYVATWARQTRATFLDQLTDGANSQQHDIMRDMLAEMAWSSDLFSETISVDRDSGSSFFRAVISRVSALKEIDERRAQVFESISGLLSIAQAVFGERAAATSTALQETGLVFARSSRNMGIAAVALAVAAIIVAVVQVWLAIVVPGPSASVPTPTVIQAPTVTPTNLNSATPDDERG